ncbi:peroxidase (Non-Heme peroxidase) [Hyphomicrobium nitrativorans NL23]|uniref:Peroxidase (Non-Heme peroxidase) n=1 Tax=Hyphomicrobium nitrativorans NL23 TaxID=1029756 RepID=V5SCT1_9HYPH|nr:alpha/beta hydrolase [Hyphomicrobium nitrativorans]AHB47840.1 peroxidase (Non-Heme peroxidase) [Hyphomicrobium nitrativorans NL23]
MSTTFKTAATKTADVDGTPFVYREIGPTGGIPVVLLHHLTATLDDWDPRIVDGLAAHHHVVAFDNRGVGGSGGTTPTTVADMARDAVAFIEKLGFAQVDLFGFSLGGFIAQVIAESNPNLVRKLVLTGTAPAGGEGVANVGAVLQDAFAKAGETNTHPKQHLFFTPSRPGLTAAAEFLARLQERTEGLDKPVSNETIQAQITAIVGWQEADPSGLAAITQPTFIANGDRDIMVPTINSFELARRLPNAQLSIFPDAGHGGIFQYHEIFVKQVLDFLR